MTNTNEPLVYKISRPTPFSGKELIGFLQIVHKKTTGGYLSSAWPLSIIETSILEDEQGQEFWTKDLSINVLEIRLKDNYNIRFIQEKLDLYIIIEDLEAFRLGCSQLVEDLVNPNKKYLVYRDFIKTYRNMLPHEKIEFHQKKIREEIARKKSSKK
ncbi:hypothetical protein QP686_06810 [Streptococcus intermedius]|uniref:hypothetical protein n=1 Tax=Streptococcus intermedius TaxID=1338 RepID=UPI00200111DF|nr:hypothetical protein [Streptococcus intermedius]MDK8091549.1 hypothetical protein [Streptococcus intermedius]